MVTLPRLYPGKVNSPVTYLNGAIDADDLSINVLNASKLIPDGELPDWYDHGFMLAVMGDGDDAETIIIETVSTNTLTVVSGGRGAEGTAKEWPDGTPIARTICVRDISDIHAFLYEMDAELKSPKRTLIIQAAGCKIPGYSAAVASSIARTGALTDADSSGTTLTCTCAGHGLKTGERVYLKLTTSTTYSGEYNVTVTSTSQFTVTLATTPGTPISNDTGNFYALGELSTMKFPASASDNSIVTTVLMPENYTGGALTVKYVFVPAADCANDTNAIFGIQAKAVYSGDPLAAVYGTAVDTTTAISASNVIGKPIESAESGSITPANSPAGGKLLQVRITRKGSDTSAIDMHLAFVRILYPTNAISDEVPA